MDPVLKDSIVVGRTSQGLEVRAVPLQLSRHRLVFEVHGRGLLLQSSEVLSELQITVRDRMLYSGRAVVKNLVDTGLVLVCEAALDGGWLDVDWTSTSRDGSCVKAEFLGLLQQWQRLYRVSSEYKVVTADLQTFLTDLRLWTEQVALGLQSAPLNNRDALEREAAVAISAAAFPAMHALFEKYEWTARQIGEEVAPFHHSYVRRQLHPLLLSSPFNHRIYAKPLGYAGDYEMMNMIWRNDYEGASLFGKILNAYILDQLPARSVRQRVECLKEKITEETLRVSRLGRMARVYSLGCGSAREVELFLSHPLANHAEFFLLDFNQETLVHVGDRMSEAKRRHHVSTPIHLIKRSVYHLLKESGKPRAGEMGYDVIYTSGLYDYLTDGVCKTLNSHLYDQLRPGGILITSNFDPSNPIRNVMEHMFEWFLIHRNAKQMQSIAPRQASPEHCRVSAEKTGVNIFLEARKP